MKPKFRHIRSLAIASSVMLCISSVNAQNSTWNSDSAGNWSDTARWLGGTVASGADFTATLGNVITADRIITLDAPYTIGNITASDTTHNYTISGGNILTLDRTTGVPVIDVTTSGRTLTISSQISGSDGLQKNGAGILLLNNTSNNYTGGTILSAGSISFAGNVDSHLGATSGGLTFSGGQINYTDGFVLNRDVTVNANMALNNAITVNGVLSGSSSITQTGSDGANFTNTGNTFTGTISSQYAMTFASLGDSANAITIGTNGWNWSGTAKTFALRPFTMSVSGSINNNGSGALIIQQNLAHSGTSARTLTLAGSNTTSTNQFAGNIANAGAGVVGLTKGAGNSIWALSGTNTYTGATTLSYGDDNGILVFQGMQALSNSTSLNQNQGGVNSRAGNIRFLDDSATPASRSGVNLNFSNIEGVGTGDLRHWMRAFVGNNSTANLGTSSSTQTGSTIQLGNLNLTEGATASTGQGLWLTGANNYRLQIANVNVTLQAGTAGNHQATLRADAPMTVTGTVRQSNDAAVGSNTTLQLEGSAAGSLISGAIRNSAGGRLMNLSKAGTGDWTLSGTNDYTGPTSVSAGILRITGDSSAATGNVSVTAGSLGGNGGSLGGAVTVSSTGGLDLRDTSVGSLTLGSTLSITGAAGANTLRFDMGNGTGTSDSLIVAGTTTLSNNQSIDLNWLGGASGRTATTYTLIGGAGTLDTTNAGRFSLPITKAFGQTYTLTHNTANNGDLDLVVANASALTPAAFWAGSSNANWNTAANWRDTLAGGGAVAGAPDFATNVTFSTQTPTPGTLATVLDTDFNINSLTLTNASGNVTIAGPGALVLEAAAVNGNTAGNAINSLKTSGTNTISARVALASSQTWTVASGGTLAVSGAVSDFGLGRSLTKAGDGTLTLSTNPTYTGATIMNGGTLDVSGQAGNPLSSSSGLTFTGTSNFTYSAANINLPSTTINPDVTANFRNTSNGAIFTFTIPSLSGSGTFSGDNPGGTGQNKIIAFSDLSNFTGVLQMNTSGASFIYQLSNLNDTVASNIRFAGNAQTLANPNRLRYVGSAGLTLTNRAIELANASNSFVAIDNNGTNNSSLIINSNLAVTTAGAKTLILGGSNTCGTSAFAGQIDNGSGTISVTKADANTWILSGTNTFTGATTISGGTLQIGAGGTTGSIPNSPIANNATLVFNRSNAMVQGTDFAVIAGTGAVIKNGSDNLTFNNANFNTGTTTVNAGKILMTNPLALQFTAYNTNGSNGSSIGLDVTNGLSSGTLTLGGLSGAVDLASAITGGYTGTVTNLTLNPQTGVTFTYTGAIANGAVGGTSLTKNGAGTQVLNGNLTYTGATILNAGVLNLGGAATLLNSSGLTLNAGAGLTLTNADNDTEDGLDRISDSDSITSNGGTITYTTTTAGSTRTFIETLGPVALTTGQLNLVNTLDKSAGSQTLALSGLTRTGATNTSAITFSNAGGLNVTNDRIRINGITTDTAADQIIGAWATVGTAANSQTDYAVYDSDGANGFVVARNVAGSAETTWTAAANAYTTSVGGTVTLTGTRTITALRNTGASTVLTLATGSNLQTFGVLNGAATLLTIAPGTGGVLTTPTGGGNLYLTSNGINSNIQGAHTGISVTAPINNNGSDAVTLVKSGVGVLQLNATSNYSGGTVLNSGTLWAQTDASLGEVNGDITFGGSATLLLSPNNGTSALTFTLPSTRSIIVNDGAMATIAGGRANATITVNGGISGSGGVTTGRVALLSDGGIGTVWAFNLLGNNTFTGEFGVGNGLETTAGGAVAGVTVNSLADSTSPITLNLGSAGFFSLGSSATANLSVPNRPVNLLNSNITIRNQDADNTMTLGAVSTSTTSAQTLKLAQGGFGGFISGAITNGAGSIAVEKTGSGTWSLSSANNTFTGAITMGLSTALTTSAGTLNYASAGGSNAITFNQSMVSPTLNYTGSANQTMSGAITASSLTTGTLTLGSTGSGAVNYSNTASLGSAGSGNKNLTLTGASTGDNILAGSWQNNTGGVATLTKSGAGTWILTNTNNTYSGATNVSAGKLLVNGTTTASAFTVANGATLGGTGTIAGTVNVSGVLSPGASIESLATGALTMASGSTFVYEVANDTPTGADMLGVNGALSLTNVNLSFDLATIAALSLPDTTWAVGDKLTLISYTGTGITSGFAGYTDDNTYNFGDNVWTFNYNDTVAGGNYGADAIIAGQTNFVTLTALTVIPEPSSVALLGTLGAMMLLRRRR